MITLDGRTLESFGLIALPGHENPILPGTRDRVIQIPGRAGGIDFGADNDVLPFRFPLAWVQESSRVELQKKVRDFAAFLMDAKGKPRSITLRFNYEPEKYYTIRYSGALTPERFVNVATFVLPLTAFDPYAYAPITEYDESYLYDSGLQYDSGLIYPNPTGFEWLYERQGSSLYNHSSLETPLNLTITGSVSNVRITILTTGKSMGFGTILAGQSLVVRGKPDYTVKAGASNALNTMVGDFIDLAPGANELIFEGLAPNATVTFDWLHKFL